MERRRLSRTDLEDALKQLPGWELQDNKLCKTFVFDSFSKAIGWMVTVAIYADKLDHHPNWSNVYNRVEVCLTTHDMNALTSWDVKLAKEMERTASG